MLLQNPEVQPDSVDMLGRTPLLLAAVPGNEEVVRMLLADGRTRQDVQDWCGSTALFAAVRNARIEVARILLEAEGGNLGGEDGFGHDLFWWARGTGNAKMLKPLTQYLGKRGSGATYKRTGRPPIGQIEGEIDYCDACLVCTYELDGCSLCKNSSFGLCRDCCAAVSFKCDDGVHIRAEDSSHYMSEYRI